MTEALRTDLNDFLFSPIANDVNGMHLTMLSALARSGVDPWVEAASLAALSRENATLKVVEVLAGVPNGPSPGDQTASLAAQLVAQLHSSPRLGLKPVSPVAAASRGDASPLPSFAALPPRVKWTIYVLAGLIWAAIVYGTVISR